MGMIQGKINGFDVFFLIYLSSLPCVAVKFAKFEAKKKKNLKKAKSQKKKNSQIKNLDSIFITRESS